jgi:hypothetical protein
LKKGFVIVDGLVDHFFEVNHLMERCPKLKHKVGTVMATYSGGIKQHAEEVAMIEHHPFLH